jgi:predicted PurR-regulated permease PerM
MAENSNHQDGRSSFSAKIWKTGAVFAFIVVLLLLFKALLSLLLLTLAAVLIAIYFHGCSGLLRRHFHWAPRLSLILSVIVNLILLTALVWLLGARMRQQAVQLADQLPATLEHARHLIGQSTIGNKALQALQASGDSGKTMKILRRFFSSGFGIVSDLYIVILMAIFFTATPSVYRKGIIRLLPPPAKDKGRELLSRLEVLLKNWLKSQIAGIISIAVLTAIGLLVIGIPLVLPLAIIAGLLNFIPNFGPLIALVPAVLIALTQSPSTALVVALMYTGIQILQSAVEKPLLQKKMMNIPPALTIFAQVAMGLLGGLWGVLLAAPVVAILQTVIGELYVGKQDGEPRP